MRQGHEGRKQAQPRASRAAALIANAVERVIGEAKDLTPDLGGMASTQRMGDATVEALEG